MNEYVFIYPDNPMVKNTIRIPFDNDNSAMAQASALVLPESRTGIKRVLVFRYFDTPGGLNYIGQTERA